MKKKALPSKEKLTAQEFNRLQEDALRAYSNAIWMLADVLKLGKDKFGRTQLMKMTRLSLSRVQWLVGIANLPTRDLDLLPDVHAEVIGNTKPNYWLRLAKSERLNSIELRKQIRKSEKSFKDTPKMKNISEYPRLLDQIGREINRMTPEERERAKQYVTSQLAKL